MSTSDASAPVGLLSHQAKRLFWTLRGPLASSVFVMPENLDPDAPREAYFRQTLAGATWHPVSQEALTNSKPSSITVQSADLDGWAGRWWELHYEHDDDDDDDNDDDDDDDDDEPASGPQRCSGCGATAPGHYGSLVAKASEKPYATVHDYVTAVHPWLMALKDDILQARNVGEDTPPAADTELVVMAPQPEHVNTKDEQGWLSDRRWARDNAYRYQGPMGQYGLGTRPDAAAVQDTAPKGTKRAGPD